MIIFRLKMYPGAIKIILILAIIYVLTAIFTWLQTYIMVIVSQRTIKDIRAELFSKLQNYSFKILRQQCPWGHYE